MFVHAHTHTHTRVRAHPGMHTHAHTQACAHTYTHVHAHMYAHTCTHIHTHTDMRSYTHTFTHTHTHTHTHTDGCFSSPSLCFELCVCVPGARRYSVIFGACCVAVCLACLLTYIPVSRQPLFIRPPPRAPDVSGPHKRRRGA